MDIKGILSLFMVIFLFAACEEQGEFEPNNLISIAEDAQAEEELALLTGSPYFTSVTLSADRVYTVGQVITITAVFQKRTRIISGTTPRIPLNIGGVTRYADYVSGSDSRDFTWTFQYTVQLGDLDHNGIELVSPWELNGTVIQDYGDQDARLTYTVPSTPGVLIDTANLSASFADGAYTNNNNPTINISAATGSNLYIGSSCLGGGGTQAFGATANFNLPSLNASNTLYVAVGNGAGGYSQCQNISIIHDNLAPNAVAGLAVGNNASDIASDVTSWSVPADNGPAGIASYQVAVSTTNNTDGSGIILPTGNWTSVGSTPNGNVTNGATPWLAPVTNYYTLVRAIDNAGNVSSVVSSAAWQIAALSPEQITSMSRVNATDDSIRVGWPYPDDNGFPITDYELQYRLQGQTTWIDAGYTGFPTRRFTVTPLNSESFYEFRVRAYNGTNYGAWSPTLTVETLPVIDFLDTPYVAINIGGATNNALVSMVDDNQIFYGNNNASPFNDGSQISADLDRGKTVAVSADEFTVVRATGSILYRW